MGKERIKGVRGCYILDISNNGEGVLLAKSYSHKEMVCMITEVLIDKGETVYSEGMTKDLELITENISRSGERIKRIGIGLFLGPKKEAYHLSDPDIVTIAGNNVTSIIEFEREKTPKKIGGIIAATRISERCYINANGMEDIPFNVKGAKLFIVLNAKKITPNIERLLEDLIDKKGNLSDIKVILLEDFLKTITT